MCLSSMRVVLEVRMYLGKARAAPPLPLVMNGDDERPQRPSGRKQQQQQQQRQRRHDG